MAKISAALYEYQKNKRLFYVPILTSLTTGGVTASFGMLGDIIIAEPDAYIAFAGKKVIEQTLNTTILKVRVGRVGLRFNPYLNGAHDTVRLKDPRSDRVSRK
ncbi:hypothetical protein Ahy_B10g106321 [Arachis hypogaea]|uniref:CoA carboxyltransferase N-terminal domain-containing protein n=1 Tax=Arachis hypogaea TaxID=3818 RepID=A0A444XAG8_ARAHY|nr:hypothetical protein Ahy_B10g106321 [Arachis hypogaea]